MLLHVKRKNNSTLITNCFFSIIGFKIPKDSCKPRNFCFWRCVELLHPLLCVCWRINISLNKNKLKVNKKVFHIFKEINVCFQIHFAGTNKSTFQFKRKILCLTLKIVAWKSFDDPYGSFQLGISYDCRIKLPSLFWENPFDDCSQNSKFCIRNMQM